MKYIYIESVVKDLKKHWVSAAVLLFVCVVSVFGISRLENQKTAEKTEEEVSYEEIMQLWDSMIANRETELAAVQKIKGELQEFTDRRTAEAASVNTDIRKALDGYGRKEVSINESINRLILEKEDFRKNYTPSGYGQVPAKGIKRILMNAAAGVLAALVIFLAYEVLKYTFCDPGLPLQDIEKREADHESAEKSGNQNL